ncbi:outer dense fiber protein 2-like isoform X1 [Platichthys flesus]|uniref:outer dense fiber protein 2-like isoform X1 n=1 Tax=Platichthys flesus TaxID=8260 RepID=UPI002DBA0707|nr:outer dense fiber protein 2-like isoform X1 [Platichthys flesus]XP_062261336.1 outer dense fiber protein 2-like isoform X1 [Platichthys flesus]XP_062261337.1 outer dense fiber protein 2-like isoform X1 [Platichthys flesus]
MSPEDEPQSPARVFGPTAEDLTASCAGGPDRSQELGRRSEARSCLQIRPPEDDISCRGASASGASPFLKTLMDAEAAANAAAVQLVSFKDAMEDEFSDSRRSTTDKRRAARQRGLLLEKLVDFKRTNKSVRQKLKQLQEAEADRIDANRHIEMLMKRITQAESDNERLNRDLTETERRFVELMDLRREEQENVKAAAHVTKSVEATRAHLQEQLRTKEAENKRLAAQLRTLERARTEQKMEIKDLRGSVATLNEKAAKDKESLKKATRAQKLRAQRFEAAVEKCYAQLKEKDAQLADARLDRDSRRRQKEQQTDEKDQLQAHVELLESQITELTARLQKERDELTAAHDTVMQRVEKLCAENGDLHVNNAALEASVARLEQQLNDCESALVEEKLELQERKHQAEQFQCQVAALQVELDEMRIKYKYILRETEKTRDGKDTEVERVRQRLQARVDELKLYPELLSAAQQSLFESQEKLRSSEGKCSEQSESVSHLQVKMGSQTNLLRSSMEMKDSIHEANVKLQERINSVQTQMERLQQENLELVRRLADQEETLSYSSRQLDQRSSENQALSRQLEAALSDVQQQVQKVKDQSVSREGSLQTQVLQLEAEKSRRDEELRRLRQKKLTAERQFEVRLKDLQLSLDQSESHKQSIQNYVDFLKNSYKTMFDEGLQTSTFTSSCFLK